MALQSKLFRGDAKLEAALVSDSAHIVQDAAGAHVGKIQQQLNELDGAGLNPDEKIWTGHRERGARLQTEAEYH